eukprot:CAMPEP_0168199682 /NCGR_PEP_ID=MMETSP0139_2-20121125/22575_1 /TAXON_ID=44445 /ORGANISM="Pseudo-nitzschia australis, Strain 10249 10 AB" /LENGTH=391 /DNA_ID=CAMNT_0008124731 /DNA_START=612 /DNA_END=1785 /DNA_ORIENTATION=+
MAVGSDGKGNGNGNGKASSSSRERPSSLSAFVKASCILLLIGTALVSASNGDARIGNESNGNGNSDSNGNRNGNRNGNSDSDNDSNSNNVNTNANTNTNTNAHVVGNDLVVKENVAPDKVHSLSLSVNGRSMIGADKQQLIVHDSGNNNKPFDYDYDYGDEEMYSASVIINRELKKEKPNTTGKPKKKNVFEEDLPKNYITIASPIICEGLFAGELTATESGTYNLPQLPDKPIYRQRFNEMFETKENLQQLKNLIQVGIIDKIPGGGSHKKKKAIVTELKGRQLLPRLIHKEDIAATEVVPFTDEKNLDDYLDIYGYGEYDDDDDDDDDDVDVDDDDDDDFDEDDDEYDEDEEDDEDDVENANYSLHGMWYRDFHMARRLGELVPDYPLN